MADGEPLPADQHSIGDTDTDDSNLSDFQAYELPQDVFAEALSETPSLDGLYTPYVSFHDTASSAATPGLHSNANATDLDVADENAAESLVEAAMNTRYSDNVERSRGVARRHSPHQAAPAQLSVTSTHTLTQTHAHAHAHAHSRPNSFSLSQANAQLPEDADTHTHNPPPGKPLACHGRVVQACTAHCVAASPTLSHLSSASYTGHSLSHNLSLTTSYTSQGNDDSDQGLLARTGPRTIKQVHSYTGTRTHSPTQRTRTRSQTNAHTSSHLSVQQRSPSATSLRFTIDERNRTSNKQRTRTAGPKTNPSRCTRTNGPSRDTHSDEKEQGRSNSSSFPSSSSASFRESFSERATSPSGNMTRHYSHTTSLPDSLNSASSSAHLDPNHYGNDPDNNDYLQHHSNDSPDISHCILDRRSSNGCSNGSILRRSDIGSAEELYRSTRSSIFSKTIRRKSSMRKMKKIHKTLSWYEPDVKRAEVEDILHSAPPGTFVVRLARTGEDYCLSVRSDVEDMSVHILIERHTDGLQLGGDNVMFNNMQDLVTYYKKHKITIEGQLSTCLKKPMCKYVQL